MKDKNSESYNQKRRVRNVIRVAEADLNADEKVESSIRNIKGIGFTLSKIIVDKCGFHEKKLIDLTQDEIDKLEALVKSPDVDSWLLNNRQYTKTGENAHFVSSELFFVQNSFISEMKKMKSYKGVRHILRLPVRGQRTKSSFRKSLGVGVSRKAVKSEKKKGALQAQERKRKK